MFRSTIYHELRLKYVLRKVSPFVLLGSVFFTLWICQMVVAIVNIPAPFIPVH